MSVFYIHDIDNSWEYNIETHVQRRTMPQNQLNLYLDILLQTLRTLNKL